MSRFPVQVPGHLGGSATQHQSNGRTPMAIKQDVLSWRGQQLTDADGDKVGTIEEIYLDNGTQEPEWALVSTGLFGNKQTFVPLADATPDENGVRVPYDKATVKDAPRIDPDGSLSHDEEAQLYQYYGREYGDDDRGSGFQRDATTGTSGTVERDADYDRDDVERGGPGRDVSGPNTDEAMTRSEE